LGSLTQACAREARGATVEPQFGAQGRGVVGLLSRGPCAKEVSAMLGHARIGITCDAYGHVMPSLRRQVVDALEDMFEEVAGRR